MASYACGDHIPHLGVWFHNPRASKIQMTFHFELRHTKSFPSNAHGNEISCST